MRDEEFLLRNFYFKIKNIGKVEGGGIRGEDALMIGLMDGLMD